MPTGNFLSVFFKYWKIRSIRPQVLLTLMQSKTRSNGINLDNGKVKSQFWNLFPKLQIYPFIFKAVNCRSYSLTKPFKNCLFGSQSKCLVKVMNLLGAVISLLYRTSIIIGWFCIIDLYNEFCRSVVTAEFVPGILHGCVRSLLRLPQFISPRDSITQPG